MIKQILIFAAVFTSIANATDNWISQAGPVTNSSNLCWRNTFWTPATADTMCDGAIQPQVKPKPIVKKITDKTKPVETVKVTLLMQSLFDFDKSIIKPEGKTALDEIATKKIGRAHV